jgi:fumarate reductase subunit D
MYFIFKITLLKHNHSSKTLECLCPRATLHVSVINLDHPQGYCSCCNATVRLVVFVTTLFGHVAVFLFVLLAVYNRTSSRRVHTTATQQKTQPHAQIKL